MQSRLKSLKHFLFCLSYTTTLKMCGEVFFPFLPSILKFMIIFSVKSYRFFSFIHYLWTFYRNLSLAFLIPDYELILRMNGRKETASEKFCLSRVIIIHLPSYIKQEDVCKKEKFSFLFLKYFSCDGNGLIRLSGNAAN